MKLSLDLSPKVFHKSKGSDKNSETSSMIDKDDTENGAVMLGIETDTEKDGSNRKEQVNDVETPEDKHETTVIVKTSPSSESEHSGLTRTRTVSDSGHEGDISDVELSEDPFSSTEKLFTRQHMLQSDLEDGNNDGQAKSLTCDGKDSDNEQKSKKS